MIKQIINWLKPKHIDDKFDGDDLPEWFFVKSDDMYIYRRVSPKNAQPWQDKIKWSMIERVCYEVTEPQFSDNIYLISQNDEKTYVVPVDADGGKLLWQKILERKLFDDNVSKKMTESSLGVFCSPPFDD